MKWSKAQDGWKSSWKFMDWMEPTIKKPRKKPRKQAKETEAAMDEGENRGSGGVELKLLICSTLRSCLSLSHNPFIANFLLASCTSPKFSKHPIKKSNIPHISNTHATSHSTSEFKLSRCIKRARIVKRKEYSRYTIGTKQNSWKKVCTVIVGLGNSYQWVLGTWHCTTISLTHPVVTGNNSDKAYGSPLLSHLIPPQSTNSQIKAIARLHKWSHSLAPVHKISSTPWKARSLCK